jgi:3-hydroxyacyl-CoA dehydrogenase / enoyl-CoA hydratase / 3-hydroxybutyryl-CoA epimerase
MNMKLTNFTYAVDTDGHALLTWNMPARAMNVITQEVMQEINAVVDAVVADSAVKGVILTSGKDTFSGGADLTMMQGAGAEIARITKEQGEEAANKFFFENCLKLTMLFRKVETCGKPWVAAINGLCLGGAFEWTLACHHRVALKTAKVGLPEIKVGIFPGAGGTQRVPRLMQTGDALQMLFKGEQIKAEKAKGMGLLHEIVSEDVVAAAKAALIAGVNPKALWDREGYKLPSGLVQSKAGMMIWPPANAIYRRETYDNYPAAKAVLQSVYEGLQLPFDLALRVEIRYFAYILRTPEAQNMIRSLFVSMGELNKGARRPAQVPFQKLTKIGVVGAGFMGASVAYVSALAGLEVVLIDREQEAAEKGKALSHKNASDAIMKGRSSSAEREALLARITPTTDYAALHDCALVIEAVFEDRKVKEPVLKAIKQAAPNAVIASNTSTLPISSLAGYVGDESQFIGVHFFSPVEKMMLVEVIKGAKTGDKALAVALDYVKAIKKTPIVVNDCRGFFANRCVGNYIREGHLMLDEGYPATMIETVAKMAGMPVGPLSLNDEVAIDLAWKVLCATKVDLGEQAIDKGQEKLLNTMVNVEGRLGRKNGKGFYDYAASGSKSLWPGLAALASHKIDVDAVDIAQMKARFLVTQALEAAKTVEEGVITDVREADVGSILGFGFAPFTGGAISYIDTMGTAKFVALCDTLTKNYGSRFEATPLLREMAVKNERFYKRFAPEKAKAA